MLSQLLRIICCVAIAVGPGLLYAQEATTELPTNRQQRKTRPQYFQAGLGASIGSVRDFATSPLTYRGVLANYSLGITRLDERREGRFTTRFNHGAYHHKTDEGILPVRSKTAVYMLDFSYMKLYRLNRLSGSRWNYKIGGHASANLDVRYNPDLMNAGLGYEVFNTFALSGKVTRVFRRSQGEVTKVLFLKFRRPMVSMLSYQFNVPVMNNTVRNGFAYIGNEQIDSAGLFKGYEAKAFTGTRVSSELAYTRQMQNGNMWRLSYFWDARLVGERFNRFEMANHVVELSILFHLNKTMQR